MESPSGRHTGRLRSFFRGALMPSNRKLSATNVAAMAVLGVSLLGI